MCDRVADTSSWRLRPDQAFLNVTNAVARPLWLYQLSDDCVRCPFARWCEVPAAARDADADDAAARRPLIVRLSTAYGQRWRLYDEDVGPLAFENRTTFASIDHPNVGQFGVYGLHCEAAAGCEFSEIEPAANGNLDPLYFLLIIAAVVTAISGANWLLKRRRQSSANAAALASADESTSSSEQHLQPSTPPLAPPKPRRLRSLDTFRGIAIVLMIFVNSGGGHYWWMEHATWNGLHVADTVFPCFLWIMGVCVPMSVRAQLTRGRTRRAIVGQVAVRSAKLFLIGLFLNTVHGPDFADVRVMGVLQRFGIAYGAVATLYVLLHCDVERPALPEQAGRVRRALRDVEQLWPLWLCMAAIVVVQFAVVFGLPVPGCPSGYLGPGGRHDWAAHPNCTGGASGHIDRLLLGDSHLYQWSVARNTYGAQALDPEGPFGSLLTIVQVFLGLQAGTTLLVFGGVGQRLRRWIVWSAVLALAGGSLAGWWWSMDDGWLPVNKHLWSGSYVLVTTALAFALLAVCYALTDVTGSWSGAPFRWAGMNSIVLYVGHMLLHQAMPFRWHAGEMNGHLVLLVADGWTAALWVAVAWWMYRRKWFVSV